MYDRLFKEPHPGTGTHSYLDDVNPKAKTVIKAYLEPSLKGAKAEERFQFERHGYFVVDKQTASQSTFNRTVSLRDSWTHK